jgi:hypothetical protein
VPSTTTTTTSEGENVPDIQPLASRVQPLQDSVDGWNTGLVWATAFAGVAAAVLAVTTFVVIRRTKDLAAAQYRLAEAKDKQLGVDLKGKDVEIAKLNETAEREALERKKIEENSHSGAGGYGRRR